MGPNILFKNQFRKKDFFRIHKQRWLRDGIFGGLIKKSPRIWYHGDGYLELGITKKSPVKISQIIRDRGNVGWGFLRPKNSPKIPSIILEIGDFDLMDFGVEIFFRGMEFFSWDGVSHQNFIQFYLLLNINNW